MDTIAKQVETAHKLGRSARTAPDAVRLARKLLAEADELTWQDEESLRNLLDYLQAWGEGDTRRLEEVHGVYHRGDLPGKEG